MISKYMPSKIRPSCSPHSLSNPPVLVKPEETELLHDKTFITLAILRDNAGMQAGAHVITALHQARPVHSLSRMSQEKLTYPAYEAKGLP